jgi:ribonuclease E
VNSKLLVIEKKGIAAFYERHSIKGLIINASEHKLGDVYLGKIHRILPPIQAIFIQLSSHSDQGFLRVADKTKIKEEFVPGKLVKVQIIKEPTKTKGPSLTTDLRLESQHFIFQPVISRRRTFQDAMNQYSQGINILVQPRFGSLQTKFLRPNLSLANMMKDLAALLNLCQTLNKPIQGNPPSLILGTNVFSDLVLRNGWGSLTSMIIVDSKQGAQTIKRKIQSWSLKGSNHTEPIVRYLTTPYSILEDFDLDLMIYDLLQPRVNIGNGAYILIEKTEALTTIDVNSGPGKTAGSPKQAILLINCRAAKHIAKHLKLRNISGLIVIDFIDMKSQEDQLELLKCLIEAFSHDEEKPQISQFSDLGLVEITRRRRGQSLVNIFSQTASIFSEPSYCITSFVSDISKGHINGLDDEFCYG